MASAKHKLFVAIDCQDENTIVNLLETDPTLIDACDVDEYSAIHKCAMVGTAGNDANSNQAS